MRSELLQLGISMNMGYVGEMATSVYGGYRRNEHATRYADQFTLGTDIDLQKLAGWDATQFSFALANRNSGTEMLSLKLILRSGTRITSRTA